MDVQKEVQEIIKNAPKIKRFPVTEESIKIIGRLLYERKVEDLWDIYHDSEEYIRVVVEVIEIFRRKKFISVANDKLALTPRGREFLKELLIKEIPKELASDLTPIKPGKGYDNILKQIKDIYNEFTAKDKFDQAPLMPEAAIKKVAFAVQKGDIAGKSVVCVGDDDFISLILALTGLPTEVLAIDIDPQVLGLIDKYAKKYNLPVRTLLHDLTKPIPKEYQYKFDTFITEPPDTVLGFTLFIDRGIQLLKKKPGCIGYAGVTQTACPPLGILKIQEILTQMGLTIVGYLPKFSTYPSVRTELQQLYVPEYVEYPPTKAWYISDLARLKTTEKTKSIYATVKDKISHYRGDSVLYQ